MASNLTEETYKKLKGEVEAAQAAAQRARGALETTMRRLKDEFGCSTIEEAQKQLKKLEKTAKEEEEEFEASLKDYRSKWPSE